MFRSPAVFLVACALAAPALLPTAFAEAATVDVAVEMEQPSYVFAEALESGIRGTVTATDGAGAALEGLPVHVAVLHRAPLVGYLRSEHFYGETGADGTFSFQVSTAFGAPGSYLVAAWVTSDGAERVGATSYRVDAA